MKKVSLLAASVAFALTGCGGSDVIFGFTNDQGQIEISGDVSGALALQT
ncbi:hypothetical protein IS519_10050 [Vibrio crassostreae]|nr:hypothetical protein [Vibrio crassostreae]UPR28554.1 hypothetical protein IS519_10050 [Vibrio crassostreae]